MILELNSREIFSQVDEEELRMGERVSRTLKGQEKCSSTYAINWGAQFGWWLSNIRRMKLFKCDALCMYVRTMV